MEKHIRENGEVTKTKF